MKTTALLITFVLSFCSSDLSAKGGFFRGFFRWYRSTHSDGTYVRPHVR